MTGSTLDLSDPTCVQDLLASRVHVERVAAWLRGRGYAVRMPPLRIRDDVDRRMEFSDTGDLYLEGLHGVAFDPHKRLEVKQRDRNYFFERREDWRYPTIIVDVQHSYDHADPKPTAYVITNEFCTACFVVHTRTRPSWLARERMDRRVGRLRRFYECPIELCSFHRMPGASELHQITRNNSATE